MTRLILEEIEQLETPAAPTEPLQGQTRISMGRNNSFEEKYFRHQNERKHRGAESYAWGVKYTKREIRKGKRTGRIGYAQSLQLLGNGSVFP